MNEPDANARLINSLLFRSHCVERALLISVNRLRELAAAFDAIDKNLTPQGAQPETITGNIIRNDIQNILSISMGEDPKNVSK